MPRSDRKTASSLLRLGLFCMTAFAIMASVKPAAALEKLVFAWPGALSSAIAPLDFAEDLGFFAEEGISVDTVVLQGSGVILPQIVGGTVFTSYITLDPLIISRDPGKPNFDIRFAYNAVRNSIWEISVLDESPVHSIKDLAGRSIGVGALTFGNVPMTKGILKREGVDPTSVQFVAVGVGVPAFEALRRKKIDALNLYDIMDKTLEQQGTKIRLLSFPPEFKGVTSHALPFRNKDIKERPQLVGGFGRAFAKGTVACLENPTGCLESYWKHNATARTEGEAAARELELLSVRLANMTTFDAGQPKAWGSFSDKDWLAATNSLAAGGLIASGDVKLDTLYTNQFVADFNRFDEGAVRAKAHAFSP
jgi:NitT/TauT family transport system substrate-binding protein